MGGSLMGDANLGLANQPGTLYISRISVNYQYLWEGFEKIRDWYWILRVFKEDFKRILQELLRWFQERSTRTLHSMRTLQTLRELHRSYKDLQSQ